MMISPQWALVSGILLSFFTAKNISLQQKSKIWSTRLLQFSVILLGASLNFYHVIQQGATGALITFISIALIFAIGDLFIRMGRLERKLGTLITMGTAICGGSAIGALAPVIAADSMAITVSMAIVFLLNALAVFVFPFIGNIMQLSQEAFGMWAALAIHDTSSVVAASTLYGSEALGVATTVKLTRALWIIPITMAFAVMRKNEDKKITYPWFVFGFVLMSLAFTFIESLQSWKDNFLFISKNGFSITLFLIGLTFNFKKMKEVGRRPFLFGFLLWILVSGASLVYVRSL